MRAADAISSSLWWYTMFHKWNIKKNNRHAVVKGVADMKKRKSEEDQEGQDTQFDGTGNQRTGDRVNSSKRIKSGEIPYSVGKLLYTQHLISALTTKASLSAVTSRPLKSDDYDEEVSMQTIYVTKIHANSV
jgi:hypothetical protein